jgi:hypothetical protein
MALDIHSLGGMVENMEGLRHVCIGVRKVLIAEGVLPRVRGWSRLLLAMLPFKQPTPRLKHQGRIL